MCRRLLKEGNKVIAIDNLLTGCQANIQDLLSLKNFTFIKYDITRPLPIKKLPAKIDYILDMACPASPVDFPRLPLEIMTVSSQGLKNLLELAKKHQARLVQASTSEVYGDPLRHPQKETYWGNVNCYGPRSCYDEGKRFAEALVYNYRRKFNLNTGIVRIFNTYGPYMRPDDGRVVSNFIVQALEGKNLTVYGTGNQTRSFCYIDDMVEGILKMMESQEEGPINLGNPREFKIIDLAKLVIKFVGKKNKIVFHSLPKDDPEKRRPYINLARQKLGYRPKIKLEEGLKKTIEWFKTKV